MRVKRPGKRWLFRLASLTFVPLVLVGLPELVLRVVGFGYPTAFFLEGERGGRSVLVENVKFGWRFFPRALARAPSPTVLSREKPAGAYRVFVFGESAAKGEPEPAFGFARMLTVLLEERFPGKRFEVVNVAMTAINSHAILAIAKDCSPLGGDFWVIYMGNNEVLGPFGAGSVFGGRPPSPGMLRVHLAVQRMRLGQLLETAFTLLGGRKGTPETWGGMEMFLKEQVRRDDPQLGVVYDSFQKNLEDILRVGVQSGAKVIACTMVSNLKDCAPFASQNGPGLSAAGAEKWRKVFAAGCQAETAGRRVEALAIYEQAAKIDPAHAELQFRMGRCCWSLEKYDEARRRYEQARDLDTIRFRADTRINQIIRETAANRGRDGIHLLDAEALFAGSSLHGVAGEKHLHEHVHFNFEGNYLLARSLAERIEGLLPPEAVTPERADWPGVEECAGRLAWTLWERHRVTEAVRTRLAKPPYMSQLNHPERDAGLARRLQELEAAIKASRFESDEEVYQKALARAEGDWVLHEQFGTFLAVFGRDERAAAELRKVIEIVPQHVVAWYKLGLLFDKPATSAEAERCFREALRRRPDFADASHGLGLALARQGKHEAACSQFAEAVRVAPDYAAAHLNWGASLVALNRAAEAAGHYQEVVRLEPKHVPARLTLGRLLWQQGKRDEASTHYARALELEPGNPLVHYELAECLSAGGKPAEALRHYSETVRLSPAHAEARYRLGVELTKAASLAEARTHLLEAVRLKPAFSQAHFALGVVAIQQGDFGEAERHFGEAARLDPTNQAAARNLAKARALKAERK